MGQLNQPKKLLYLVGQHSELALGILKELLKQVPVEVSCDGKIASHRIDSDCSVLVLDDSGNLSNKAERLTTSGFKKKVILNLEDLSLVRISSQIPHEIFWLSTTDPVHRLGVLIDGFQGAYFRGEEVVVSLGNEFSLFAFPEVSSLAPSFKNIALAGALCAKLYGLTDEEIQQRLQVVAKTLSRPEWKVFSEYKVKEAL